MAEWLKAIVLKTIVQSTHGFESLFIQIKFLNMKVQNTKKVLKNPKFKEIKEKKNFFDKVPLTPVKTAKVSITKKTNSTKDLYKKILGTITKKGKKNLAKKALNHSLYITSRLYRISSYKILPGILKNLKCYAEIRKVVRRKNVTLIPFPLTKGRRRFLKIKWLLQGAKKSKEKISFTHKLYEEFVKILEKPAYLKTERTEMNRLILNNISNAHFR